MGNLWYLMGITHDFDHTRPLPISIVAWWCRHMVCSESRGVVSLEVC